MCRSKSDPRGFYRCVPDSAFLLASSSPDIINPKDSSYIRGAFWKGNQQTPTIEDILYVREGIGKRTYEYLLQPEIDTETGKSKHQHDKLENEYIHLGNMISTLVDSRVHNLNARIIDIQTLVHQHANLNKNIAPRNQVAKMEKDIANKSLSLGYEIQQETIAVFNEAGITGKPIDERYFSGDKEMKELFVENSKYFPSNWNDCIRKMKSIKKAPRNKTSAHTTNRRVPIVGWKNRDLFEIAKGKDGLFCYPSLEAGREAQENNPLDYHSKHEIVHEMTHMFEKPSRPLKAATAQFLLRRAHKNQDGEPLRYPKLKSNVLVDSFTNKLTGTVYSNDPRQNEIMARGTESVFLGSNGSLVGLPSIGNDKNGEPVIIDNIPDIEHRNFTLGILAGVELEHNV